MIALYFLNLFFLADSQTGKILLQPYKLYLVITHFPASIYKTTSEEKQGSNSHPFAKNPVERKPTVFSANVACCIKLEMTVTMIPVLWALAHLPTTWHICSGQALSCDLEQKQSMISEVVLAFFFFNKCPL